MVEAAGPDLALAMLEGARASYAAAIVAGLGDRDIVTVALRSADSLI